jgi:hypothetical protein
VDLVGFFLQGLIGFLVGLRLGDWDTTDLQGLTNNEDCDVSATGLYLYHDHSMEKMDKNGE